MCTMPTSMATQAEGALLLKGAEIAHAKAIQTVSGGLEWEDPPRHERLVAHLEKALDSIRCLWLSEEDRVDIEARLFQIGSWLKDPDPFKCIVSHLKKAQALIPFLDMSEEERGQVKLHLQRISSWA